MSEEEETIWVLVEVVVENDPFRGVCEGAW